MIALIFNTTLELVWEKNKNHINLPDEGLATEQTECTQQKQADRLS